ncbi:hypothetical protein JQN72_01605 [Phycicoccus sp. CSK15P-2]|uniref:hypothetical protein n=1 Tax=Phycicoccus sp. CSK15P-2 TaxID=2807627 RepID=UPI00194ECEA7|nr:hypothetical protein [Phycicoccus sp. CSK15P-2]MBM6402942.1 hypothetical protein [Phycicoccus sp. CSK15P-2]
MKSRIVQAGAGSGIVLGLVFVVGVAVGAPWLAALAGAGLGLAVLVLLADTNRRVRRLQTVIARGGLPDAPPATTEVTEADVLGTVRLLQAQYTGRLDRLQHAVEELAAASRRDHAAP